MLAILLFSLPAFSAQGTFPTPKGAVNDFAGIIGASDAQRMEDISREVLKKTETAIVVAVMQSIGDNDLNDYATSLYNTWGIGKKGKDKGVLIFLALKERKIRIATGSGMGGILPDKLAGEILDRYVVPYLKEGQYGKGLANGCIAVASVIAQDARVKLNYAMEEEQGKRQKAPGQQAKGGGIRTGTSVKWDFNCATLYIAWGSGGVHGTVDPSVDLTDDQIAYQLLKEGRRVGKQSCLGSAGLNGVWVRLYQNNQLVSAIVTENGFESYYNPMAAAARQSRSITSFISKFKVEVWLASNEMKSRLASNPFQWKGKVVGFKAEFGGMLSEGSGIFDLGMGLSLIVVKRLPSARFTRSGEQFLLAGRVQGVTQVTLPFLGNAPVPELSFIGVEKAPPE